MLADLPLEIDSEVVPATFLTPLDKAAYLQLWSQFAGADVLQRIVITNAIVSGLVVVLLMVFHAYKKLT